MVRDSHTYTYTYTHIHLFLGCFLAVSNDEFNLTIPFCRSFHGLSEYVLIFDGILKTKKL